MDDEYMERLRQAAEIARKRHFAHLTGSHHKGRPRRNTSIGSEKAQRIKQSVLAVRHRTASSYGIAASQAEKPPYPAQLASAPELDSRERLSRNDSLRSLAQSFATESHSSVDSIIPRHQMPYSQFSGDAAYNGKNAHKKTIRIFPRSADGPKKTMEIVYEASGRVYFFVLHDNRGGSYLFYASTDYSKDTPGLMSLIRETVDGHERITGFKPVLLDEIIIYLQGHMREAVKTACQNPTEVPIGMIGTLDDRVGKRIKGNYAHTMDISMLPGYSN